MEFRLFNHKEELEAQRSLFQECFPENIGTPVMESFHYTWKFHTKPGAKTSNEFVACDANDIVGYYAAIPYSYAYKDTVLNAAMVCDVMTGIKARGKGVFTRLGIHSTEAMAGNGFDFTTGYPIREEVIPGHMKAGWEKHFELPLYGRFIRFNSFLKKRKIGFLAPFMNAGYRIVTSFKKLSNGKKGSLDVTVHNNQQLDNIPGLEEFYSNWSNEIPISLIKDLDFLKWRLGAPEKNYHILTLRNNSEVVGVLIAREVEKEGVPCMGILELALLDGYHDKANILVNELIAISKRNGSELLLTMMSEIWMKKYKLKRSSFMRTPFKFYLIVKQLNSALNFTEIMKEQNWHLTWIDSDDL
ncbi:MAG: GNAT family N-acetyltransferase [Crocinitomicaceae bacterium]|nr:GNAT family N-acetyltransferase [Crocinitomicaceae bacterium]